MNSTGNDIVSLNAVNIPRTLQPRFYSKILCATEIAVYSEAGLTQIPFERYVWLLWSIKESAYKFLQRHNPGLVFSPTKFIVTGLYIPATNSPALMEGAGFEDEQVYKSTITFASKTLYSRSLINEDFIFSIVNHEDHFENIFWGIRSMDSSEPARQSADVRSFLMDKLNGLVPYNNLSISKDQHGCPMLMRGTQELNIPVSLTHHGYYVAYSCRLHEIVHS